MATSNRAQRRRLTNILVDEGLVSQEDVDEAIRIKNNTGENLGTILIDMDCLGPHDIPKILCTHFQLPFISFRNYDIETKLVSLFPPEFLHQHKLLPFDSVGEMLLCAVTEIPSDKTLAEIPRITKRKVALYTGLMEEIEKVLNEACPLSEDSELSKRRSHLKTAKPKDPGDDAQSQAIFDGTTAETLSDQLDTTWDSIFEAVGQEEEPQTPDDDEAE